MSSDLIIVLLSIPTIILCFFLGYGMAKWKDDLYQERKEILDRIEKRSQQRWWL